ncbi:30S ribosome-binding factor RbfA [Psychrobium sp. 1_MG-2023]|uniref:30S ribosome-binding factor RbfA n=1 Tax=Psychrobium sp. 1_MG-2023 TaxID=3062624 RepID=UPI000C33C7DD|nr:30S ribosome-binding factor RbfA [Psychrobium sp. 1_MG-2023]MDP2562852.1 30S ribosome-binding factor RbfA [Psychrobium sp. 1_MG-2023]PKF54291.1 30S ribosome-binding factor RbfA [Alteromonadales bacterium alter-6D02]
MAREFSRSRRVAQQLQKELAQIVMREIKASEFGMITINAVDLSNDLSYAKVYFTQLHDDAELIKKSLELLNESAPYIRSLMGSQMRLRIVPDLKFYYDKSLSEGIRMTSLVNQAVRDDNAKNPERESGEE